MSGSVIPCVGAVVTDEQGRLLMIKRGHEPGAGLWSIPGGRIEPGETDAEALVREMLEETGLTVQVGRLLGTVQRPGLDGAILDVRDYAATVTGGTLAAGDDAADARWVRADDLNALPLTEGLAEILTSWGVLGQERQLSSHSSAYTPRYLFVLPVVTVPFMVATQCRLGTGLRYRSNLGLGRSMIRDALEVGPGRWQPSHGCRLWRGTHHGSFGMMGWLRRVLA